jgi:hypothetical protein
VIIIIQIVKKNIFFKSLGVGQVKLETTIIMIKKYPKIFKNYQYLIHKNPYAFKKYVPYLENIRYFQNILDRYTNKIQKTQRDKKVIRWAKRELRFYIRKMQKYKYYYNKDLLLAQLLLLDLGLNVKVGTLYLITNYNEAKKRGLWNPWLKAISRYNGGWYNKKYRKKIFKNMKIVRNLKKKGIIK